MNKKDILPLLLRSALSLLAAILAGVVLLTAVYALPTARMRHNVSISLPYILSEGDRYQWAPYHNGTELDGTVYLDPQGSATRAQCAAMLMRFVENAK